MVIELTPKMRPSFLSDEQHIPCLLPTQTAHYAREETEKIEVRSYKSGSLNSPRSGQDTLKAIKDNKSLIERFPIGDDMDELLEPKLPGRTNYIHKLIPRDLPEYIRDPTIQLIRHSPSLSVLEDTSSSEDLENEMSLLELEESKPNLPIAGTNAGWYLHKFP